MTLTEITIAVKKYVAEHDIFWLADLKKHLNVTDQYSNEYNYISRVCIKLQREGVIMCCDKSKGHTQYIRVIK